MEKTKLQFKLEFLISQNIYMKIIYFNVEPTE